MIQKHLEIMFDDKVIIFDHSDHVTVKVDWSEPVQVVRMVIWEFFNPPPKQHMDQSRPFDVFNGHDMFSQG